MFRREDGGKRRSAGVKLGIRVEHSLLSWERAGGRFSRDSRPECEPHKGWLHQGISCLTVWQLEVQGHGVLGRVSHPGLWSGSCCLLIDSVKAEWSGSSSLPVSTAHLPANPGLVRPRGMWSGRVHAVLLFGALVRATHCCMPLP